MSKQLINSLTGLYELKKLIENSNADATEDNTDFQAVVFDRLKYLLPNFINELDKAEQAILDKKSEIVLPLLQDARDSVRIPFKVRCKYTRNLSDKALQAIRDDIEAGELHRKDIAKKHLVSDHIIRKLANKTQKPTKVLSQKRIYSDAELIEAKKLFCTHEKIAAHLGVSRSSVTKRLSLIVH